jgi:hypothetical protein
MVFFWRHRENTEKLLSIALSEQRYEPGTEKYAAEVQNTLRQR